MKAVILAGGEGTRLRPLTLALPKPVVPVVDRPFLRHQLDLLATVGITEVVFSLAYQPQRIKAVFGDGSGLGLRIHYAVEATPLGTGGAVKNAEPYLDDTTIVFNGDVLTDAPLAELVEDFKQRDAVAAFVRVRVPPSYTFHVVGVKDEHHVSHIEDVKSTGLWLNGGYFIFRQAIFDYLYEGEELVHEPFQRLIQENKLISYPHEGFWAPMDTVKERQALETMLEAGRPPWALWQHEQGRA
jgi:NDP-sugar pyrophosphorylase family protein